MPRSTSMAFVAAAAAQQTSEALLALVTISHPSIIGGPLRLVQDMQDLTSNGNLYTAFPFSVQLPDDSDDGVAQVKLTIDNVDQSIMVALRGLAPTEPPTVQVDLVLSSQPNVVEASFPNMTLRNVTGDALTIEGELRMDEEDLSTFPQDSFTPQNFPGMFV